MDRIISESTLNSLLNEYSSVDSQARTDILDIKTKLIQQTSIVFPNVSVSGSSFIDTFETNGSVDPQSTAIYDSYNKDIKFNDNQILKLPDASYDKFNKMVMNLYPKKVNKLKATKSMNNNTVMKIESIDKIPKIGNKLLIGTSLNEITDIQSNNIVVDRTNNDNMEYRGYKPSPQIDISSTILSTGVFNKECFAMDSKGNFYVLYAPGPADTAGKMMCYKSSDRGNTWVDLNIKSVLKTSGVFFPTLAIDSNDNLHVSYFKTTNNTIGYIKYNGTSWVNNSIIYSSETYVQSYPMIAVDSNNNIHIVWQGCDSSNPTNTQIKYSKFSNNVWSLPINISASPSYPQANAFIVIDSNNNVHVAWEGRTATTSVVAINYSKFTSSWSAPIVLTSASASSTNVSMAVDSNNNIHIVYSYNSNNWIYYIKSISNVWGAPARVDGATSSGLQTYPSIAIDHNNIPHVIWAGATTTYTTIQQVNYNSMKTGAWGTPIIFNNTSTSSKHFYPTICRGIKFFGTTLPLVLHQVGTYLNVAGDSYNSSYGVKIPTYANITNDIYQGNYLVTDYSYDYKSDFISDYNGILYYICSNSNTQLRCYRSINYGKNWADTNFPQISGYDQLQPSFVVDSENNIHVVWNSKDSTHSGGSIKYSKFDGISWSSPVLISDANYSSNRPCIAIDSKNNLHVVWSGYGNTSTSYYQIYYKKFNGQSWSTVSNVYLITGYQQSSPKITVDNNDNLHVVWSGYDATSTSYPQIRYCKFDNVVWKYYKLTSSTINSQDAPSIVTDSKNNIHVVWSGYTSATSYDQIQYMKYDNSTGVWGSILIPNPTSGYFQRFPNMCIDVDDVVHLVFFGVTSTGMPVKYLKCINGVWSEPILYYNEINYVSMFSVNPVLCKNIDSFVEPFISVGVLGVPAINIPPTVEFRGKISTTNRHIVTLKEPATVQNGNYIRIMDLLPSLNDVDIPFSYADYEKFIFIAENLGDITNANVSIKGDNSRLECISYNVS